MYAFSFSSFRLSNFDFQTAVDIISLRLGSPNRIEAPNTQPHKLVLCNSRKLLEFRASLKEMLNFDRRSILRILLGATAAQTARASTTVLRVGGASVEVSLDPQGFDLPQEALLDWVKSAALAVTGYYGRFPVPKAGVRIISAERKGVSGGRSFGNHGAQCRISVGHSTTVADLKEDWMLTHAMVHFGFPSVPERNHWIEEGTATYVEPIARARAGIMSITRAWFEMVRDMPQGLPAAGDKGLDQTHTWGRTYWGGALFCLLADVGIRKRTANGKGLEDAMRAINRAGGTIDADWPVERAFEIGDKATGGKTLMELYEKMRSAPVMVDLPDLWKQLGVERRDGMVVFDDHAPLAAIRKSII